MKKFNLFSMILAAALAGGLALGADEVIRQDKVKIGKPASGADKVIELDTGSGSNAQISSDSAQRIKLRSNTVRKGRGAATDIVDEFDIGAGANNPKFRWNNTTGKIEFAHDGVTYEEVGSGGGGGSGGIVLNENPGFEDGSTNWTASGGTFTINTTLSNVGFGLQSGAWDASAASQTLSGQSVAVPAGLYGKICSLSWYYKGGDGNLKAQVYDGTNVIAESSVFSAQATFSAKQAFYFTCPTSGNIQPRFIASADAAIVYLDDVRLGQETLLSAPGNGPTWSGYFDVDGSWSNTASYPTLTDYADDASSTLVETHNSGMGTVTKAGNKPGITFTAKYDGFTETCLDATRDVFTANAYTIFDLFDGTNSSVGVFGNSSNMSETSRQCVITQVIAGNSYTVKTRAAVSAGTTRLNGYSDSRTSFTIKYIKVNGGSEDSLTVDQSGWYVDANIGGANINTSVSASYIELTNAGLDMVIEPGSAAAEIPCSSTNPSTGLTCSAGSESVGVVFTPPSAGKYEVCIGAQHFVDLNNGDSNTAFEVVRTPNNAQTILARGGMRKNTRVGSSVTSRMALPFDVCGDFILSDTSKATFRLMHEREADSGTVTSSFIYADRSATVGDRDIRVRVRRRVEYADVVKIASTVKVGTFLSASLPGTRVTGTAPAALGEYRSYLRNASARTFTETNGAPAITPSSANGIPLYIGNPWNTADTANNPTTYDVYVGPNKVVTPRFYASAGKTGFIDTDKFPFSTYDVGYAHHYDPTTGIFRITRPTVLGAGATSGHYAGTNETGDASGASVIYFDLFIEAP